MLSALPIRPTARAITLSIHSCRGTCCVSRSSWCSAASIASEAIPLKTLPFPVSLALPALMFSACQKAFSTSRAWRSSRRCSHHLVKMMNHEYADISASRIRVPFATKSPCAHSALSPYGFSTETVSGSMVVSSSERFVVCSYGHTVAAAGLGQSVKRNVTAKMCHIGNRLAVFLARGRNASCAALP